MNNEQIKIIKVGGDQGLFTDEQHHQQSLSAEHSPIRGIETEETRREEESVIIDAEKVRAGEEAEAAERAAEVADGVDLPLAPEDGPEASAEGDSDSQGPIDFDDDEDQPDDHGRGLV